jgi:hypothetical protein
MSSYSCLWCVFRNYGLVWRFQWKHSQGSLMIPGKRLQLQHFYPSFSYLHIEFFPRVFFFLFFVFSLLLFDIIIIGHSIQQLGPLYLNCPDSSFFLEFFLKERKEEKREKSQTWDNSPWPLRIYGRCIRFFFRSVMGKKELKLPLAAILFYMLYMTTHDFIYDYILPWFRCSLSSTIFVTRRVFRLSTLATTIYLTTVFWRITKDNSNCEGMECRIMMRVKLKLESEHPKHYSLFI